MEVLEVKRHGNGKNRMKIIDTHKMSFMKKEQRDKNIHYK